MLTFRIPLETSISNIIGQCRSW